MHNLIVYITLLFVFLAIDMVWLNVLAKDYYRRTMAKWMSKKPNLTAALVFYLIYIFALYLLVIHPAVRDHSGLSSWWLAGVFGIAAYSTYDLTNLAVMKNWPVKLTIIDIVWGGIVTAITAIITLAIFA